MKKCCCCLLRTAATIIAIWNITAGIFILILPLLAYTLLSSTGMVRDVRVQNSDDDTHWLVEPDVEESILFLEHEKVPFWTAENISVMIYGLILGILGCILLHGIRKKLEKLMLIWIIGSATIIILNFLLKVFVAFTAIGIAEIVILSIQIFFIKIVFDHRNEIQEESIVILPSAVKPFIRG